MDHSPIKLTIVGNIEAGKTTLVKRLLNNFDPEKPPGPSQGNTFDHETVVIDGLDVPLEIWDTAGTEAYRSLVPMALRGAEIVLVTFAVNDRVSFSAVDGWVDLVRQRSDMLKGIILVGNKCDLRGKQETVEYEEAVNASEQLHCQEYVETSALVGTGVSELGVAIVRFSAGPRVKMETLQEGDRRQDGGGCCP
jgi:small GTP-binding protein